MRFYIIFTLIFMLMLLGSLIQVRRQRGLSRGAFALALVVGVFVSALLASTRMMPEAWSLESARVAWWLGYGTFGLVAYVFLFQTMLLLAEAGARLAQPELAPAFRSRRAFFVATALAVSTVAWGVAQGGMVRVLTHRIASPKVLKPLRVALVSDLHLGALTLTSRVRELVELVRAQNADVVLLVGDIVNDHPEDLEPLASMLKGMTPRLGMYGVFGNHERYEGDEKSARVFRWAGAELVRNRVLDLPGTGVQLLGVDDPGRAGSATEDIAREIRSVAAMSDPASFRLLMNHRPLAWREAAQPEGIELMLSGHTHRGQLFPFYYVVRMVTEFMGGFYEENGKVLAVSAGAGFWGPPMRVLAPADIMVLDIVPKS